MTVYNDEIFSKTFTTDKRKPTTLSETIKNKQKKAFKTMHFTNQIKGNILHAVEALQIRLVM